MQGQAQQEANAFKNL